VSKKLHTYVETCVRMVHVLHHMSLVNTRAACLFKMPYSYSIFHKGFSSKLPLLTLMH